MSARYFLSLLLICTAFLGIEMLGALQRSEEGVTVAWTSALMIAVVRWYSWMAVMPFVHMVARRARPRGRAVAAYVRVAVPFILLHQVALGFAAYLAGWSPQRIDLRFLLPRAIPDVALYTALSFSLAMAESRRRLADADAHLRAALAEARLDALRQQLNPHFLFNTLNHIVMQLRLNETPEGIRMLLALSDLLHIVLADGAQLTPLQREMEGVELYLEIERARFGEKLQVEVSLDARALDARIPSFMLQPLLENAMRHGVSPVDGSCHVRLSVRAEGDRLVIEVRDDGPGVSSGAAAGLGIGLANTRERLRHLYGDDHHFALSTRPGSGAVVSVDIPLRKA